MYKLTDFHAAIIGKNDRLDRSVWSAPDGFLAVRIGGKWYRIIDLERVAHVEITR